jgi:hypothetical protein
MTTTLEASIRDLIQHVLERNAPALAAAITPVIVELVEEQIEEHTTDRLADLRVQLEQANGGTDD